MIVRTISTLPRTTTVNPDSLIEVSVPLTQLGTQTRFASNSMTLSTLEDEFYRATYDSITSAFGLSDEVGRPINVGELSSKVHAIENENIAFRGTKTFYSAPQLDASVTLSSDMTKSLATVEYVENRIANAPTFIGQSSNYRAAQTTSNTFVDQDGKTNEAVSNHIYEWNLSATPNSDGNGNSHSNEVVVNQTGSLVMYGWMTAESSTDTQECWIALEANIHGRWVVVAVQPWVVGEKSQYMQYVGFNLQVKAGLTLRITTGVRINTSASRYQTGKTLVYNKNDVSTNITNTFVGYIFE